LGDQPRGGPRVEWPGSEAVGERDPADELLDEVTHAVVGPAGLVERDDARVLELGGAAGLAEESINFVGPRQPPGPQDFDRDLAFQFRVEGAEDRPERPAAEFLAEFELA